MILIKSNTTTIIEQESTQTYVQSSAPTQTSKKTKMMICWLMRFLWLHV